MSFFVQHVYRPARLERGELVRQGSWSRPRLIAWIARRGEPGAEVVPVDLGPAARVENAARTFLEGLGGRRGEALGGVDPGAELRGLLWDPLLEYIGDAPLVFLSHDRFTATVPFEVLTDADGRHLVEDRAFVNLHDLSALASFVDPVERDLSSLFVVGGVDFNDRGETEPSDAPANRGELGAPVERWRFWRGLDATRAEVETIRDLHEAFLADGRCVLVTGVEATEERVLEELPHASLVHLATHGYFRPEGLPSMWQAAQDEAGRQRSAGGSGQRGGLLEADRQLTGYLPEVLSGLVFAGANLEPSTTRADGYLTAADVDWLDLSGIELVTLSACETGLGRSESGEGVSGFRTTLLRAGAKTVISSLWKVPDDSTEQLMSRFYENLLRHGMGKLEALREAQLWMIRENRRKYDGDARPHTWGAFVLSGDWR